MSNVSHLGKASVIHHGYDDEGMKVYAGGNVIYVIPATKFPDEIGRMAERLRALSPATTA